MYGVLIYISDIHLRLMYISHLHSWFHQINYGKHDFNFGCSKGLQKTYSLRSKTFFLWWVCRRCWVDKFSLSLSVILLKFISSKIQFACFCIKRRGIWLELEIITLSEINQTDKDNYFEEKEQSSRVRMIWSWILVRSIY